jgi:hypothetical protein
MAFMQHHPALFAEARSVGYSMAGIAAAVAMAGLVAAWSLHWWLHRLPSDALSGPETTLTRTLVGKQMRIPLAWFRGGAARQQGFASEIDLEVGLPLAANGKELEVEVALLPLSQVRPSAGLLDGVYLHQFMPNEVAGPAGLVGKPLYGSEGFEGETVWYDPLSQQPFVAKCSEPVTDGAEAQCLRTVALEGGIAAVYTFPATALEHWRQFDPEMAKVLGRIGAL